MSNNVDPRGRKFVALLISSALLIFIILCIVVLALLDKEVPGALGVVAISLASVYPGYLGVNVYQKKIEAKKPEAV